MVTAYSIMCVLPPYVVRQLKISLHFSEMLAKVDGWGEEGVH
jgi:hypothetical protein